MTLFISPLRKLAFAGALAAAMALGAQPAVSQEGDQDAAEMSKGEQRLAKLLEGRVAGEPQSCINEFRNSQLRVIKDTAYVYGRGDTIWVQRTRNPESIDDDDILVSQRLSGRLCRQDINYTIDRFGHFYSGAVFFDDFIPYTRVKDGEG